MPVTVHTVPVTQQASNQHPQMSSCAEMCDQAVRCESGSQATDGRYASMYKVHFQYFYVPRIQTSGYSRRILTSDVWNNLDKP